MMNPRLVLIPILSAALFPLSLVAQKTVETDAELPPISDPNLSLKKEIEHSIDLATKWFKTQQDPETGSWSESDQPALTALPLSAIMGNPTRDRSTVPAHAAKAYQFLVSKQKDDGGIYGKGLACYNTSLSLMAMLLNPDEDLKNAKLDARRFLINQQSDFDIKGEADNIYDGGTGYGGTYAHSDLSNTHFVLQALHYSRNLAAESGSAIDRKMDLDWDAAITFVSRCQNTAENSDDEEKGGFVYFPGSSKAGTKQLHDGRVALRSYGSMSYAGLLSFIYAGLEKDDPRVESVLTWLKQNYTLDENPGMEQEGLFYYYHTMAKALAIVDIDVLELADGTKVDWRRDLAVHLINLQKADGSWGNPTGRWWEHDRVLVTAYCTLALEHIHTTF